MACRAQLRRPKQMTFASILRSICCTPDSLSPSCCAAGQCAQRVSRDDYALPSDSWYRRALPYRVPCAAVLEDEPLKLNACSAHYRVPPVSVTQLAVALFDSLDGKAELAPPPPAATTIDTTSVRLPTAVHALEKNAALGCPHSQGLTPAALVDSMTILWPPEASAAAHKQQQ
eukprot:scaffold712_cov404-Prasinococcus_capsulatus_cf.AAC.16